MVKVADNIEVHAKYSSYFNKGLGCILNLAAIPMRKVLQVSKGFERFEKSRDHINFTAIPMQLSFNHIQSNVIFNYFTNGDYIKYSLETLERKTK